jgi:hypothetical protein
MGALSRIVLQSQASSSRGALPDRREIAAVIVLVVLVARAV